jgi:hypothetical protein
VTDVPRRSYPLVVAPPGGFENAVKRGRSLRRRRVGGSSGLALVLVGALGYGVLGGGGGVDELRPTDDKRDLRTASPVPGGVLVTTPTPQPTSSPGSRPVALPTHKPGTGTGGGVRPSVGPSSVVVPPPSDERPPSTGGGRRYAPRNRIERDDDITNTEPDCLGRESQEWCVVPYVDATNGVDGQYVVTYTLCRSRAFPAKTVRFDYRDELELIATDTEHEDVVWTYSLGRSRVVEPEDVTFQPGMCSAWQVVWDGLDDYGRLPPQGPYTMTITPRSRDALPSGEAAFDHH